MFSSTKKTPRTAPIGVKTEFIYADGAKDDVQLSGDWNDWKAIQMFHEGGGMWSVVTPVPPGAHEFKYIVDGEWKHSTRHPTIGIDELSLNNVRYVLPQPEVGEAGYPETPGKRTPRNMRSPKNGLKAKNSSGRTSVRNSTRNSTTRKSFGSIFSKSK